MKPTSYLFSERNGRFQLYLGGMGTVDGLRLFSKDTRISKIKVHANPATDARRSRADETTAAAVEYLEPIDGIYDFSCTIGDDTEYSTHDDCECHFDSADQKTIETLVIAAAPSDSSERLWELLTSKPGCYVVIEADGEFKSYPNFDSLLASREGE